MVQLRASATRSAKLTAWALMTGSVPGSPAQIIGPTDPGWGTGNVFTGTTAPVVTVDFSQRRYTAEAAKAAGLGDVTLLEEPQAAFYAWMAQTGTEWRNLIADGDIVLVCDVGGGTADFSLIRSQMSKAAWNWSVSASASTFC